MLEKQKRRKEYSRKNNIIKIKLMAKKKKVKKVAKKRKK